MARNFWKAKKAQRKSERGDVSSKKRVCNVDLSVLNILKPAYNLKDSEYIEIQDVQVKITSDRHPVFQKSVKCACCGIEGQYLGVDLPKDSQKAHFNLYAVKDGKEILMTKDHIVPFSKGGKNHTDNYQTMCSECNRDKGVNLNINLPKQMVDVLTHTLGVNEDLTFSRNQFAADEDHDDWGTLTAMCNMGLMTKSRPFWTPSYIFKATPVAMEIIVEILKNNK